MNKDHGKNIDLSVNLAGIQLSNPIIAASGTFGYGLEYSGIITISRLGGICSKGLTLEARPGNKGRRVFETPSGMMNSVGLENPGIPHFINHELPQMKALGPLIVPNLSGSSLENYVEGARLLNEAGVDCLELNISCPNVKAGGMAWGMDAKAAETITVAVRKVFHKPLIVKLSPNAPYIVDVAKACVSSGADALSLINTVQAFAVDIEKGKPVFENQTAGLSGPAIRPIALRLLRDIIRGVPECLIDKNKSPRIPVIGLGGIQSWHDAIEFIMTGATALQIGTATFADPDTLEAVIDGMLTFLQRKGYTSLAEIRGIAVLYD